MKRRIVAVCLLIVLAMSAAVPACAHEDQDAHDRDLKYALFGSREKALNGQAKIRFAAIADAAALAIDQFSPNPTARWKEGVYDQLQSELQALGVPGLSVSFDQLDLNRNASADGKNITANSHRKYTHQGWNYQGYPNAEFWKTRRQVLVHAVNWTLFHGDAPFSWVPWLSDVLYSPSEQCQAFSAMVYYIHILGDHIEGDVPEKLTDLEPLVQYASMSTPGILVELREQLQIVFASQRNSWTYAALIEDLTHLSLQIEKSCGGWSAVDTAEKCALNQQYASALLETLSSYLPILLRNESFFSTHFTS